MTNVFISYSRNDMDFVRDLRDALTRRGYVVIVDNMDLAAGATWGNAISLAIEDADAFVFVISPDSVMWGAYCREDLAHAVAYDKRLIPIVRQDVVPEALPEPLRRYLPIPFREDDDFDRALQFLVEAINR